MNSLTYDNFFEIAKNLPATDLLSLCSSNKQYHGFCRRPDFYHNLIRVKYNLVIPDATYKDYRFIDELKRIKLDPIPFETVKGDKAESTELDQEYQEIVEEAEEILNEYKQIELQAYLSGGPIRYFTHPHSLLFYLDQDEADALNGLWFSAYTVEGALLKYKDLYGRSGAFGDFISYISYNGYQDKEMVLTLDDLEEYGQEPRFTDEDPIELMETKRPDLDQDPDGSKLKKAYNNCLAEIKRATYVDKKSKGNITKQVQRYYEIEMASKGKTRYFVINPIQFYPREEYQRQLSFFRSLTGTVIVAGSPEGAILRLFGYLVPSFTKVLAEIIDSNDYSYDSDDLINILAITSDEIYDQRSDMTDQCYLLEINQPRII